MTAFSADWLALREVADRAARSASIVDEIVSRLPRKGVARVLDLGSGTGANVRYLADMLPDEQDWMLVDHDPLLVAEMPAAVGAWAVGHRLERGTDGVGLHFRRGRVRCRLEGRCLDLGHLEGAWWFDGRQLVTGSALLDLVSANWLRSLARQCRSRQALVLFALTYDGRIQCTPAEDGDEMVRELVNRHQERDKGFGPALGPAASAAAERCFIEAGYIVIRQRSDWVLEPDTPLLQQRLIDGWAQAAVETAPAKGGVIADWRDRRQAHVLAGRSRLVVGHEDFAGWVRPWTSRGTDQS
jgi:hypothetical protein